MFSIRRAALLVLLTVSSFAQKNVNTNKPLAPVNEAKEPSARLPVKRVVLYKNGVGYFEHTTRVRGTQELNIDFTTGQLNDVLKSLTVVDLGEGRISSVRYNSIAPLSERLKGLRLPFGEEVTRDDFLIALRGARVEVHSGSASASGKLLSIDKIKKQTAKGDLIESTEFSIVTDAGEMRNFELGPGTSVRLAERDLNDEVGRYLNLVGSSRARDLRRMTIAATGSGQRDVFVSYISEVPVWKSTYRIILPEKPEAKPRLQGWAIVDNTIGEDWNDVHLTLVAGAPQSFVQELSQPFYTRRPVIPLPESVQLTPQSHEATLEEENAPVPPPPVAAPSAQFGSGGGGIGSGQGGGIGAFHGAGDSRAKAGSASTVVEVTGANVSTVDTTASVLDAALARQRSEAEAKEVGDFFQYDLAQRVTLAKNQSALVPILNAPVEADKVTLWNEDSGALRAVWLKNTSSQTLDSGTFNIIDSGSFAGEGVFAVVHPNERRLLSYAADTAVQVKSQVVSVDDPYTHVVIARGMMVLTRERRQDTKYEIRNADSSARDVVLEHPVQENWKPASDGPKAEESSASFHRFRVRVDPAKTETLVVKEFMPESTQYVLTNLNSNIIAVLTKQNRVTPAMQDAFNRILAQKQKIGDLDQQLADRKQETTQIANDQSRLRENMKALKGSPEEKALIQRYTGELNGQEDRLAILRKESADLKSQREQKEAELESMVLQFAVDERF